MGRLRNYIRSWSQGSRRGRMSEPEEPREEPFYRRMMEARFGEGAMPEGLEIGYLLPEATIEGWDGEIYMHPTDAGDFAISRSVHEMLLDDSLGHPEIQRLRDYGISVKRGAKSLEGMGIESEDAAAFGNMVYALACAKSLTKYGDPMSSSEGNTEAMMRKALEIGIVPEDLQPMLSEAILILEKRNRQGG